MLGAITRREPFAGKDEARCELRCHSFVSPIDRPHHTGRLPAAKAVATNRTLSYHI